MKFGIVVFPGSNCDHDCRHVLANILGEETFFIWHKDTDLGGADCLVLPGGFSYGDYLRAGACAARSPVMNSVKKFAKAGGLVIGICNGFQILAEAGLVPGVLLRNANLKFVCKDVLVRVESSSTPFTGKCGVGDVVRMPIAHMDGNFYIDKKSFARIESKRQLLFRYCDANGNIACEACPNGALENVAGVMNEEGNVCGMMPHPERCSEAMLGNRDGLKIFESIIEWWNKK